MLFEQAGKRISNPAFDELDITYEIFKKIQSIVIQYNILPSFDNETKNEVRFLLSQLLYLLINIKENIPKNKKNTKYTALMKNYSNIVTLYANLINSLRNSKKYKKLIIKIFKTYTSYEIKQILNIVNHDVEKNFNDAFYYHSLFNNYNILYHNNIPEFINFINTFLDSKGKQYEDKIKTTV